MYVQSPILLLAVVFENFRNMCLKIYELDPAKFLSAPALTWQESLKKTQVKLDLLTHIDMSLMVEKHIKRRRNKSLHLDYSKYMKDYGKNKEQLHFQYWDVNNLYYWAKPQNFLINNFEWIQDATQFNKDSIKNFNEESGEGYFFEVDFQYLKRLNEFQNNLLFLPERMKIKKFKKLAANFNFHKTEYVIHITNLKQAFNNGLVLKKLHTLIKFNRNAWLKPYIDMNSDLRKTF